MGEQVRSTGILLRKDQPNHTIWSARIEQQIVATGALVTDFSMIRSGRAGTRASGGYLIPHVRHVAQTTPMAWESLKTRAGVR